MCGIAGFLNPGTVYGTDHLHAMAREMADVLIHRGPDDDGVWVDEKVGCALSHRRLSILDLSQEGHQPMLSTSGRYVIVHNGEVYNFFSLRRELEKQGEKFRGHSDTEVMLAAIEAWGLMAAVKRFVGMFAFALWDCGERKLHLVRDRVGIKPLYYGWIKRTFVFGSELKAIKAFPTFQQPIDRGVLALYMRHNYVPAPYSIYSGIYKLLPGSILTIDKDTRPGCFELETYWSARTIAEEGVSAPFAGSDDEAVQQLDELLRDAVKMRMKSDVPLGAFLSGGYDSSTVVALMQAQSESPVKTYSIGFHEEGYNEAEHAKAVAAHLGTDHTELYVTPEEAMAVIPKLPVLNDEPFSDSSQIPTFLVSKLARSEVIVSLSGDGGDELFSGYSRYRLGEDLWRKIGCLSLRGRQILNWCIMNIPDCILDKTLFWLAPILRRYGREGAASYKLEKLAEVLAIDGPDELYQRLVSHWKDPAALVLGAEEPLTALTDPSRQANLQDFTQRMMFTDLISYLPDDILTKVDRASMGVSLETRLPLLDHRVVEFAWKLPLSLKVRNGQSKLILRQVLYSYVPKELVERPKMGFGIPIGTWLRGPLRDWAEALLDEKRLREEGFFDPLPIREKWIEHISGVRNWQYYLWDVLMFQAWVENQNE